MKILHNPRCRKSREGLQILEESDQDFQIVEYLKKPLNTEEIEKVIEALGIEPIDLIRKNEADWKENFKGRDLSREEIIRAMSDYPKLIERPVVIRGNQAVVGRPPENIRKFIS